MYNLTSVFDHPISSQLLFGELLAKDEVLKRKWRDLRMSPLLFTLDRLLLIAAKLGRNRSPVLGLRIRSKNGTEPFLGRPKQKKNDERLLIEYSWLH